MVRMVVVTKTCACIVFEWDMVLASSRFSRVSQMPQPSVVPLLGYDLSVLLPLQTRICPAMILDHLLSETRDVQPHKRRSNQKKNF